MLWLQERFDLIVRCGSPTTQVLSHTYMPTEKNLRNMEFRSPTSCEMCIPAPGACGYRARSGIHKRA